MRENGKKKSELSWGMRKVEGVVIEWNKGLNISALGVSNSVNPEK